MGNIKNKHTNNFFRNSNALWNHDKSVIPILIIALDAVKSQIIDYTNVSEIAITLI